MILKLYFIILYSYLRQCNVGDFDARMRHFLYCTYSKYYEDTNPPPPLLCLLLQLYYMSSSIAEFKYFIG